MVNDGSRKHLSLNTTMDAIQGHAKVKFIFENEIILRLVCFWIFIEGGLGGIMHFLHIPLTGFIVGGFSVIVNVLIAHFSNTNRTVILKALYVVLLAKFIISPYAPFPAYIAVFFQGFLAAVIFPMLKVNNFSVFMFSILCMLESAIQKPLFAYLIFGKELGNGIYLFINQFFNDNDSSINLIGGLAGAYFLLYVLWALCLGLWSLRFIRSYIGFQNLYRDAITKVDYRDLKEIGAKRKTKVINLVIISVLLTLSLITVFKYGESIWMYLFRTICAIVMIYFTIPWILRVIKSRSSRQGNYLVAYGLDRFPLMRQKTAFAYDYAKRYKGLRRIEVFVHLLIWIAVFHDEG